MKRADIFRNDNGHELLDILDQFSGYRIDRVAVGVGHQVDPAETVGHAVMQFAGFNKAVHFNDVVGTVFADEGFQPLAAGGFRTHDFERVVVIQDGCIVEDGAPGDLSADPDSHYHALDQADSAVHRELWGGADWRHLQLVNGRISESDQVREVR